MIHTGKPQKSPTHFLLHGSFTRSFGESCSHNSGIQMPLLVLQAMESLNDLYYHTNRQIYLTTLFFYHITLILWCCSLNWSEMRLSPQPASLFFGEKNVPGLIKAQSNRRSKADIFLRDDSRAKSNRMEQSLFSQIGSSFLVAESLHPLWRSAWER